MITSDFLVIGGRIIGLSIARELKKRNPEFGIIILEKEDNCRLYASGRNRGMLMLGSTIPSTLKTKFKGT